MITRSDNPWRIDRIDTLDSTSLELRRRIAGGLDTPHALVAARQTGGLGRLGRRWHSPRGGLWLSVAWPRPRPDPLLGLRSSVAVARIVRSLAAGAPCLPAVGLKWPNDVLIDGRKAAGVLVELIGPRADRWAVIGVGINASFGPEQLDPEVRDGATTLRAALGAPIDLASLEADVLAALRDLLEGRLRPDDDLADAGAMLWGVGAPATVTLADGTAHAGILEGLAPDGAPVLRRDGIRWTAPPGAELGIETPA